MKILKKFKGFLLIKNNDNELFQIKQLKNSKNNFIRKWSYTLVAIDTDDHKRFSQISYELSRKFDEVGYTSTQREAIEICRTID